MKIEKKYDAENIQLIKNTYAKDLTHDEFNLYIKVAQHRQLDPIIGQIIPVVYNADNPKYRKVAHQITVDGQRCIAARMKDYRPSEQPVEIIYNESLKDKNLNPLGIERAVYYAHKKDKESGEWYKVAGEAYWEEYAPIKEIWEYCKEAGKKQPSGKYELQAGNWQKMPRVMISKCAEMQALRKGWAEDFGNLYSEEELEAGENTILATQALENLEQQKREERIAFNKDSLLLQFEAGEGLQQVPYGDVFDRVSEKVMQMESPTEIEVFKRVNATPLQSFWAKNKSDALELNKQIDKKYQELMKETEVKEA